MLTDLGAPAGPLKAYAAFIEAWFRDKAEQDGETPGRWMPAEGAEALTSQPNRRRRSRRSKR